jgi:DNA-binding response OmpR family regulator
MEEEPLREEKTANTPLQGRTKPARRILVVEDDRDIRHLNTALLTNSGYQVDAAEDGAAAWNALQLKHYDLIVTDNDMPNVTGVDLLHRLRDAGMTLPVIMATGTWPEEEFARHPRIKPAAVLLKPYTFHKLLGIVKEVLGAAPPIPE